MKKLIRIFLAFFLINNVALSKDFDEADLFEEIGKSTVVVLRTTFDGREALSQGSGAVFKSTKNFNYILTNDHVCAPLEISSFIVSSDAKIIEKAQIVKSRKEIDLCILKTKNNVGSASDIYNENNRPGSRVYIKAITDAEEKGKMPLRGGLFISTLLGAFQLKTHRVFFEQVWPGASGSGVFNKNKKIVGLVSMTRPGNPISYMVDVEIIREFIKDVKFD